MTLQEQAFINWYDNQPTFGVDYQEIWDAACAWQREQLDEEIKILNHTINDLELELSLLENRSSQ